MTGFANDHVRHDGTAQETGAGRLLLVGVEDGLMTIGETAIEANAKTEHHQSHVDRSPQAAADIRIMG